MPKRVVVIASGETERRALPLLVEHLAEQSVAVEDVRVPPRHRAITVAVAERIIRSVWFERPPDARPHKFVVLLDADGKRPEDVIAPIHADLPSRLRDIGASIQFAWAQQHLEAWYFADAKGLRHHLDRNLGNVDPSQPDAIDNPKLHLKNLLDPLPYTSLVAAEIAAGLDAGTILERSPSFGGFIAAVKNGAGETDAS